MIYIVEYPKVQEPKGYKWNDPDPSTAVRECPQCGDIMRVPPDTEVKTMWPPLYHFHCACGHREFKHHPLAAMVEV